MQLKVGVGSESELESESDNRNFPESELESDDETFDSTALVTAQSHAWMMVVMVSGLANS